MRTRNRYFFHTSLNGGRGELKWHLIPQHDPINAPNDVSFWGVRASSSCGDPICTKEYGEIFVHNPLNGIPLRLHAQPINASASPAHSSKIKARLHAYEPSHWLHMWEKVQKEPQKKLQSADRCLCGLSASSSGAFPSQLAVYDHLYAALGL